MTSSATLLSFGSRTNTSQTTPTDISHDSHLITSGYSNASYDSATGLINIPVTAGQATIGFGSYVPQSYTGPGAMYLYAVIIKDSAGNVLVNEEFNNWTGTLPTNTGEKAAQFTGDAGRTWNVYTNASSIYTGYGAAFASKTASSDKGVVYPADGGGPFKVLMSTDLNIADGVTGLTVDLRWGYQINNSGADARTFSLGFQNQSVSAKDLFSFLGTAPADTTPPTLAITSDLAKLNAGQTSTVTFTFSEDPGATFTSSDVVVSGGTLGALSGSGMVRTAVFTPTASTEATASISVAAGTYTDAAGNNGLASSLSIPVDTKAPTLAISSDLSALKAGQAATVTFTFSEDPGVSFTSSGIAVTGGTLGALSGTGLVRTAVFTPTASLEGNASISVTGANYADAAGNTGSAATLSMAVDTKAPTLAISSDMAALKAGQAAAVTFTFSENPGASFTAGGVSVSGGSLGALSGTGLVRTAVFTPNANMEGSATIAVAGANYADAAGNTGSASQLAIAVDTKAPTLAITSDMAALKAGQTGTVTFTFSDNPGASFTAGSIAVSGGTLGVLSGTGLVRNAVFTPSANTEVTAAISVAGANYADAAGNIGSASSLSIAVDTKPPTLAISSNLSALKAGQAATVTFTFSENPGASFTSSDIAVTGGTLGALSGAGLVRTAVFTPTANMEGSANLSVAGAGYADAAGNAGSSATLSIAVDTKPPALAISSDMAALKAGDAATVTFTFSEDPGASFTSGGIAVSGGTLGALSGTGLVLTAVFTPSINTETTASISVAGANYADAAGNTGSAAQLAIAVDTKPPALAISSDMATLKAGQTSTLSFTFSEDPGASFGAGSVAVSGGMLGPLSGTGLVRTAVFTPNANTEATAHISVAGANYADAAGNTGSASQLAIAIDTKPPTLAISSDMAALKAGQAATVTFNFSEDPGASFTSGGIAVSGGTLGALSGTGLVRTAVFTPSINTETTASISVAGANYADAAGNTGSATQLAIAIDTKPPALAISSDMAALKAGQASNVTFTFSEDPGASFSSDGIAVSGGTLGALSGTGLVRTAVFTPAANTEATATISVAGANYADAAGNTGSAASLAIAVDTKPPTLAIASNMADLVAAETATITFTFSEDPGASFTLADVTASGGTVANLAGTGLTRTVVFTPTANSSGSASVAVAAGAYTDAAGNGGGAAAMAPMLYTTVAPAITFSKLALSQDTGARDFVTAVADQTVSATLSAALVRGQKVLGSLDGGAHWLDITNKVNGTSLVWTGVTLADSGTLMLEVMDGAGQTSTVAKQAYLVDHFAPTDIVLSSNWVLDSAGSNAVVGGLEVNDRTPNDAFDISLASSGDGRSADNGDFEIVNGQLVALDPANMSPGNKHIFVRVTDIVGHTISRAMTVQVVHGTVQAGPGGDGDNIANIVEQQVPVLRAANGQFVAGDGNGDGIADSAQSNVTSAPFLKSGTAQSNPGTSAQVYVSLVADSLAGKADAAGHAELHSVTQLDAPHNKPADLSMPLGQISFTASVQAGTTEHFSLFVDNSVPVNGYWKQAASGEWVNLASAQYGGSVTMDGGKIRLDFAITDGGQFDADGKADGTITDPGAPGYRGSMADTDNDAFPDALEAANGLTVGVKDNDVFGSSKLFVMQLYRDILYREADGAGLNFWQAQIDSGKLSKAQVAASFLQSQEVVDGTAAVARLYVGGLGHMPDIASLHNWIDVLHGGSTISAVAGNIAAGTEFQAKYGALDNASFTSQLFQDVLHRSAGQAEIVQWASALDKGASRGDLLATLAGSAENVAATSHLIAVALGYYDMLGRAPEQAGQDYWTNVLDHGASVVGLVGSFIASPEYHGRFLP